jgi:hypothetical protein
MDEERVDEGRTEGPRESEGKSRRRQGAWTEAR